MKKLFGIACVLFCFLNFSIAAYAETAVDTSAVDALLAEIDARTRSISAGITFQISGRVMLT